MKLLIKVKPNSIQKEVIRLEGNKYLVKLTSPAEKNKANLELVKILSKHFSIPAKNIIIKAGLTNKEKIIEVKDEI